MDEVTQKRPSSPHSTVPCDAGEKPQSRQHIPEAPCIGFNGRPPELRFRVAGRRLRIVYIDMSALCMM